MLSIVNEMLLSVNDRLRSTNIIFSIFYWPLLLWTCFAWSCTYSAKLSLLFTYTCVYNSIWKKYLLIITTFSLQRHLLFLLHPMLFTSWRSEARIFAVYQLLFTFRTPFDPYIFSTYSHKNIKNYLINSLYSMHNFLHSHWIIQFQKQGIPIRFRKNLEWFIIQQRRSLLYTEDNGIRRSIMA